MQVVFPFLLPSQAQAAFAQTPSLSLIPFSMLQLAVRYSTASLQKLRLVYVGLSLVTKSVCSALAL